MIALAGSSGSGGVERLGLLASAVSGRTLCVAAAAAGDPTWTDGATVFVGAEVEPITAVTVQASLLAAGSLAPDIATRLRRRPKLSRRYLAIEGFRALAANEDMLPSRVRALVDHDVAARYDSPADCLAVAASRETIADPPEWFGEIRTHKLSTSCQRDDPVAQGRHSPRNRRGSTTAGPDDEALDGAEDVLDVFSSPVGGGGALGRLLQKMLGAVRQLGSGGPPGADVATHGAQHGVRGRGAVLSSAPPPPFAERVSAALGLTYPEWDRHRHRYRPDWCTVRETPSALADDMSGGWPGGRSLRKPLARLGVGLDRYHRQAQGDDLDIDAVVEARVELLAGSAPDESVYVDSLRRRRDLSVLVLLDVSGSAAEPAAAGTTVHEQQRAAAGGITSALHDLGDRVALFAFRSNGRSAVDVIPVKRFDGHLDAQVERRLNGLTPGGYSRLGAAIRHGAAVLDAKGGTPRRLLVVLSDGLAYDHGYERAYGAADARRALSEARRRGTGCLCLTIGAATDVEELRMVFGSAAYASIPRPEELGAMIGPLFRSALRSGEGRRNVA